jgi:hypothetical protein
MIIQTTAGQSIETNISAVNTDDSITIDANDILKLAHDLMSLGLLAHEAGAITDQRQSTSDEYCLPDGTPF